jgi:hypothetical protein
LVDSEVIFSSPQQKRDQIMQINHPCVITARLMAGIKVSDAYVSIDYAGESQNGRTRYKVCVNSLEFSYDDTELQSGTQCGNLYDGLKSALSFLYACGESVNYYNRTGCHGENEDLYPNHVAQWCAANEDELSYALMELEENPNAIEE